MVGCCSGRGGFYAYPFIDVRVLGYPRVFGNVVLVGLLFVALAAGAIVLARRLPRHSWIAGMR